MAIYSLRALINGVLHPIGDSDSGRINSLRIGTEALSTELTKTILDKLILINTAADADGTFDSQYAAIGHDHSGVYETIDATILREADIIDNLLSTSTTDPLSANQGRILKDLADAKVASADLSSTATSKGASLVGVEDSAANYTATTVEGVLAEIATSLGAQNEASEIGYSNTTSGLTATDVQAAIDEVEGRLDTAESTLTSHNHDNLYYTETELGSTVDSSAGADLVGATTVGAGSATTVQGVMEELNSSIGTVSSSLTTHETDTTNPHSVTKTQVGLSNVTNDTQLPLTGGTMSGDIAMGSNKITSSYAPVNANDLTNKNYVDSAVSGIAWKEPVEAFNLIGNASIATINGLTPSAGDQYVATDAGTPTAGTSDALVAGSIAEYNGTSWIEIVAGSGGFVPAGTRAILSASTALIAPYTDATDDGKIVSFTGSSNTGVDTGDAADANAVLVQDPAHVSVYDNLGYVFEGTVPTGTWIQFTGAGQLNAGVGLVKDGNTLNALLGAGVKELPSDEIGLDLAISGGLELTTTATEGQLQIAAAGVTNAMLAGSIADGKLASDYVQTSEVDDSSIEWTGTALQVKALGITNAMLAGSITDSKLNQITTANKVAGSAVQLAASSGLEDSTGLRIAASGVTNDMLAGSIATTKLADSTEIAEAVTFFGSTDISAAEAETLTDGSAADTLHKHKNVYVTFTNNTGSTLSAGDVVALSQTVAGEIIAADATALSTCESVAGIVAETITNGSAGLVQISGEAIVAQTVAFDLGKRVYVSETAKQGTKTAPTTVSSVVYHLGGATATNKVLLNPYLVAVN